MMTVQQDKQSDLTIVDEKLFSKTQVKFREAKRSTEYERCTSGPQ